MSKIIVTGGAGFIGSHLVDRLVKDNQVIVIDNLSSGKEENLNPKAEFHNLDISDFDNIEPLFKDVDCVFHLAAIPRVPFSVKDPITTSEVNILGTVNVFKAAADNNVKRVIFASSSSVYGDQDQQPLKENMLPNAISPYALQKLVGEQFAKLFTDLYKLPVVCLRYFNVFGPRLDPESEYSLVIGKFLKQRSESIPLTIFGDGEQTRGFSYVEDVVEANIKAMENNLKGGEIINIGSKESYSINYLAKWFGGEVSYLPKRIGDVLHTQSDINLAKELLDWEPKVDFNQGLEKTKKWFQEKYGK